MLQLSGDVSGTGLLEVGTATPFLIISAGQYIYYASAIDLGGASANSVTFDDQHGSLVLEEPTQFSGTITPTGDGDEIDLAGVQLKSVTGTSYSGDASGGTLTIDENGTTLNLKFAGAFTESSFTLSTGPKPLFDGVTLTAPSLAVIVKSGQPVDPNIQQLPDPTGNAESIARIYLAAFNRAPDLAGLQSYTSQVDAGTLSLKQVAETAPTSSEFLADYGALSNADFVTQLYKNADGRTPDPGGLAAYTNTLDAGTSRGTVLLDIAESGESRLHSVGVAGDANDAAVYRLYEAIDGRAPDPAGQIAYSGALASGQSLDQIAGSMLGDTEFAGKYGTPDNTTFVTNLYHNLLGRAPDTPGLNSYVNDLAGGESRSSVVASFSSSNEARSVTSAATHDGFVNAQY